MKINRKEKTREFYWVNKDDGTFCMDGEIHNMSEYDLNDIFRGSDIKDGVLERHFRAIQLMRDIDADCYYTKFMDITTPSKDSTCIIYQFLCGNIFAMHSSQECNRLAELLSIVDTFFVSAVLDDERAKEHGNHILCVTFSIDNIWKKSNLDYIRKETEKPVLKNSGVFERGE